MNVKRLFERDHSFETIWTVEKVLDIFMTRESFGLGGIVTLHGGLIGPALSLQWQSTAGWLIICEIERLSKEMSNIAENRRKWDLKVMQKIHYFLT